MKRARKNFTAAEKMTLLRRHLIDKVPVSTVCDEAKLQPTVFYRWTGGSRIHSWCFVPSGQ